MIVAKIIVDKQKLNIINCYALNDYQPSFFQQVFDQEHIIVDVDHCIVGRDFITILSDRDVTGGCNHHSKSTVNIISVITLQKL